MYDKNIRYRIWRTNQIPYRFFTLKQLRRDLLQQARQTKKESDWDALVTVDLAFDAIRYAGENI